MKNPFKKSFYQKNIKYIVLFISISLFLFSLPQDAYCAGSNDYCSSWFGVLLIGWVWILLGEKSAICWLANPCLFISWGSIKIVKISLLFSILAVLISLSFLLQNGIYMDESWTIYPILTYWVWFWLWLASSAILVISNTYSILNQKHI